jgi:hypothetical protein
MPVVNIGATEKHYGFLCRKADGKNRTRKKGEPEVRVSDIAGPIFAKAMEEEMKKG